MGFSYFLIDKESVANVIKVLCTFVAMNKKMAIRKNIPLIVLSVSLLLYLLAICCPSFFSTFYTQGVYKYVSQAGSHFFALIPFSFAELMIVLLPVCIGYFLVKGAYLILFQRTKALLFWKRLVINISKLICYILSAFILFAGVNYQRVPIATSMGLEIAPASKDDLKELCFFLRDKTNELSFLTGRTKEGKFLPVHSFWEAKEKIAQAYDSLSIIYPAFRGSYPSAKPLLFSHYLSYAHVMGFFFPFTFESNINKDIPEFFIPAVIAHEQAHLRGFMREDEAEFSLFLLCRHTSDIDLMYSFILSLFIRSISVLYKIDSDAYSLLLEGLSAPLLRDLYDNSTYWRAFQSPVGAISKSVNDAYLKANSQSDGVQSYGRVVDLLIADYKRNQINKKQLYENQCP